MLIWWEWELSGDDWRVDIVCEVCGLLVEGNSDVELVWTLDLKRGSRDR